jgi:hypothetical protein
MDCQAVSGFRSVNVPRDFEKGGDIDLDQVAFDLDRLNFIRAAIPKRLHPLSKRSS